MYRFSRSFQGVVDNAYNLNLARLQSLPIIATYTIAFIFYLRESTTYFFKLSEFGHSGPTPSLPRLSSPSQPLLPPKPQRTARSWIAASGNDRTMVAFNLANRHGALLQALTAFEARFCSPERSACPLASLIIARVLHLAC